MGWHHPLIRSPFTDLLGHTRQHSSQVAVPKVKGLETAAAKAVKLPWKSPSLRGNLPSAMKYKDKPKLQISAFLRLWIFFADEKQLRMEKVNPQTYSDPKWWAFCLNKMVTYDGRKVRNRQKKQAKVSQGQKCEGKADPIVFLLKGGKVVRWLKLFQTLEI